MRKRMWNGSEGRKRWRKGITRNTLNIDVAETNRLRLVLLVLADVRC